jgi:DNA-binding NtrC family response regulator
MGSLRSIMVVDADPTVLMNQAAYLEDEGFTVLTATTGEVALRMLTREPSPELVVLNVRLADMNGEEFILRAHGIAPALRFLIHTGSPEYAVPQALSEIGITEQDIVRKPAQDLSVLRGAISRLLTSEGSNNGV